MRIRLALQDLSCSPSWPSPVRRACRGRTNRPGRLRKNASSARRSPPSASPTRSNWSRSSSCCRSSSSCSRGMGISRHRASPAILARSCRQLTGQPGCALARLESDERGRMRCTLEGDALESSRRSDTALRSDVATLRRELAEVAWRQRTPSPICDPSSPPSSRAVRPPRAAPISSASTPSCARTASARRSRRGCARWRASSSASASSRRMRKSPGGSIPSESRAAPGRRAARSRTRRWGLALTGASSSQALHSRVLALDPRAHRSRRSTRGCSIAGLRLELSALRDRADSQPESAVVSAEREAETPREELPAEEALETDASSRGRSSGGCSSGARAGRAGVAARGRARNGRTAPTRGSTRAPTRETGRAAASRSPLGELAAGPAPAQYPHPRFRADRGRERGHPSLARACDARVLVEPPPSLEERVQGGLSVRFFVRGDLDGASAEDLRQACWDLGARSDPPSWRRSADRDPEQPES
jgi:hypothetical protein